MAIGADKRSVFAVYIEDLPAPTEPPPQATSPEVRRLLEWLQHTWGKRTICTRDIYRHTTAGKENALKLAATLEKRGWLIPLRAHRYDRKRWQITIGPAARHRPQKQPTVTTQALKNSQLSFPAKKGQLSLRTRSDDNGLSGTGK